MTHSLIVGGTKGLGREVTKLLLDRGDNVSVISRSGANKNDDFFKKASCYKLDIEKIENISELVDEIYKNNGPINYLIFLQRYRGNDDKWTGEIKVSLSATKTFVDECLKYMNSEGDKALLATSSVFSQFVGEGQEISYHVAKAALEQMMKFYAVEYGPKGIRSNSIIPFTFLKEESKKFYLENTELLQLYQDIIPLSRMGTTKDSAELINFLCSSKASFITGQNIMIDGGLSLNWPESMARKMKGI